MVKSNAIFTLRILHHRRINWHCVIVILCLLFFVTKWQFVVRSLNFVTKNNEKRIIITQYQLIQINIIQTGLYNKPGTYIRPRRNDRGMCPRAGYVSLRDKAPIKALKYPYLDLVLKLLSHNCKQELVEWHGVQRKLRTLVLIR